MDVFQYSPLDLDRPAIRLVRLKAAREGPRIDCEFIEAFFDEDYIPDYEAISYTWGSVSTPSEIHLHGVKFAVTENLSSVLQDVRYPDEDRILWVDAVCIDQGSHSELGHQVQQMDQIYRRAHRVIIWLGPLTDPTSLLMDSLVDLHSQIPGIDWPPHDPRWQINRDRLKDRTAGALCTLQQAFFDLLKRPWFRRVWVIQEVANARAALVHCGPKSITARIFAACPSLLDIQSTQDMEQNSYTHCQAVLDVMPGPSRRDSWWNQDRDLRTLLQKFSNTEATREHDKVYALLGLCPEAHARIPVDYTQAIPQLTKSAVSHICSCDIKYLEFIEYTTVGALVYHLDQLHYRIFESLLSYAEPTLIDAFILEHGNRLAFTEESTLAAMANDHHMRYSFSTILKLYRNSDADRSSAARVLPEVVAFGSAAFVEDFLQRIPDCNLGMRSESGHLALTEASRVGNVEIVRMLLDRGADCNTKDASLRSPLEYAGIQGNEAVFKLLLERGAVLSKEKDGQGTMLTRAIERGQKVLVRHMVDRGANLEDLSSDGNTALVVASRCGNEGLVRLLLEHGADCDHTNRAGNTPIMMASVRGHEKIVRILLDKGADCGIRNLNDETPLFRAAELGNTAVVRLLLNRRVEFETKHSFRATPLSIARTMQHWEIAQLFIERGANDETAQEAQRQYEVRFKPTEQRREEDSGSEKVYSGSEGNLGGN